MSLKVFDIDLVLISRKRSLVILLAPDYIQDKTVVIHRCHDAHIYLIGPVQNLILSRCRNCVIYGGVVKNNLVLDHCLNTSISAYCTRFIARGQLNRIQAYLSCLTRPLVVMDREEALDIRFGPFNKWHQGILKELQQVGHSIALSQWHYPLALRSQTQPTLINPTDFHFSQIPFDRPLLNSCEPMSKDACLPEPRSMQSDVLEPRLMQSDEPLQQPLEAQQLIAQLPDTFKTWLQGIEPLLKKVRLLFKTQGEDHLQQLVEERFEKWLAQENRLVSIGALHSMEQDILSLEPHLE